MAKQFLVTPEFCNGKKMINHHPTIHTAAREFAERLADALEPSMLSEASAHVRQVTLEIVDTDEPHRQRWVDSGIFECPEIDE